MTYYDLNMNSKRINNTQDPSANQDIATKNYMDVFTLNTPYYYPNQLTGGRAGGIIASNIDMTQIARFIDYGFVTTGCPIFYSVYLKAGTVVSRGLFYVAASGTNILGYFGLYNKNGVLLAVSNQINLPSGFTVNSTNEIALTSTYTVPTTDFYYLALLITSTGSYPTVPHAGPLGSSASAYANLINFPQTAQEVNTGNLSVFRSAITTVSTGGVLPASLNTFTLTNLGIQFWLGIS